MIPLPGALGDGELLAWRLDHEKFASTWDSGEGAFRLGGRWNASGSRAVYCAIDPATAILEVAVHKTFRILDTVPHVLSCMRIIDRSNIKIVQPDEIPNPNWLIPGVPSAGQQAFGTELLKQHSFVLIPSAVSSHSWNLVFDPILAKDSYTLETQQRFALDTRLHASASPSNS